MKRKIISSHFILWLFPFLLHAESVPDIALRHHAQWKVDQVSLQKVSAKYGLISIKFDKNGHVVPMGLPSSQLSRWEQLYHMCMKDGCVYCDADSGSCDTGTCGSHNSLCKPFLDTNGRPKCGTECANYAFSFLIQA